MITQEKYDQRIREYKEDYKKISDDDLLEEIKENTNRCSNDMCLACAKQDIVLKEIRRRMHN